MHFTVASLGRDPLGLRETLDRFANEQWLPAHATPEQAAEIVLDQFKRTLAQTLEMLVVEEALPSQPFSCDSGPGEGSKVAAFAAQEPVGEMAGFGSAGAGRKYRATVLRSTSSSRAIRRCDQPAAYS